MNLGIFPDPTAPMNAVEQIWRENADLVDRFKLAASPGGAVANSWFVMVYCGIPDPDAYELGQALHKLQSLVEQRSGLDVTLMLANSPEQENGVHSKR